MVETEIYNLVQQTAIATQKQTRWLPLLGAAREFENRLDELTKKYTVILPGQQWNKNSALPSYARDFCELYMLSEDPDSINDWNDSNVDPGVLRKNEGAVERVRRRMLHELTFAEDSLYKTATYLGYAQRVRKELEQGWLIIPKEVKKEIMHLLQKVRNELNGTSREHQGAGIISERQVSIGEYIWNQKEDCVISDFEFREKLLRVPDWMEFTDLFRFFVHFHLKVNTEVLKTKEALEPLCTALESMCFSESSS